MGTDRKLSTLSAGYSQIGKEVCDVNRTQLRTIMLIGDQIINLNTATDAEIVNYIIGRRNNNSAPYRAELESKARFQIQALAMRLRRDHEDEMRMQAIR